METTPNWPDTVQLAICMLAVCFVAWLAYKFFAGR